MLLQSLELFQLRLQIKRREIGSEQDSLNPQKYRYSKAFAGLEAANTHVVAIVLFRFRAVESAGPERNNYVVTAYQKVIG